MDSTSKPPRSKPHSTALSLNQLVRLYCRERLMVDPVEWTGRHLELLQCSFDQPCQAPLPSSEHKDELDKTLEDKSRAGAVKRLSTETDFSWREIKIDQILASSECPLTSLRGSLGFYFNRHLVRDLPCQLFSAAERTGIAPILLAYIDREYIQELRLKEMRYHRGRRPSKPTNALFDLHVKRITPLNRLHDPYLVALLLAVAHRQRASLGGSAHYKSKFWPQVLMTDREEEFVHLFAAQISSSFLSKLDFPSYKPSLLARRPLLVHHITVPLKPYKTFRRRIFPLLLHPSDYYKQD